MKKILFLAIVAVLFGCKSKDNEPTKPFQLDPSAMINIRPAVGAWKVKSQSDTTIIDTIHLSALEIVRQAEGMGLLVDSVLKGTIGFASRDTVNLSLKRWGADIIDINGELVTNLIRSRDNIIFKIISEKTIDTIAYIPNSTVRDAERKIYAAFAAKDNQAVYEIFDKAFVFKPITGKEWRALRAIGKQ